MLAPGRELLAAEIRTELLPNASKNADSLPKYATTHDLVHHKDDIQPIFTWQNEYLMSLKVNTTLLNANHSKCPCCMSSFTSSGRWIAILIASYRMFTGVMICLFLSESISMLFLNNNLNPSLTFEQSIKRVFISNVRILDTRSLSSTGLLRYTNSPSLFSANLSYTYKQNMSKNLHGNRKIEQSLSRADELNVDMLLVMYFNWLMYYAL